MDFFENDSKDKLEKEIEDRKTHSIWCEKYRPLTLDNFVGNELLKQKLSQYIKEQSVSHLLLHGRPGTGKTTASHILTKNIQCDSLYINASSENSVQTVRDKIMAFASSIGFRDLKIITLDECDYMSPSAQAALRNVMETFSSNTRFILTCNYVEKIIEPIISRCQTFELIPPSKKDVAAHVFNILRKEQVEAKPADLKFIIDSMYPDIRRIINTLQFQTVENKLVVDQKSLIDSDYKLKLLETLKDQRIEKKDAFKQIRQILADNSITQFDDMYKLLYDNVDEYAVGHIAQIILILAECQYKSSFSVDKEINAASALIQILNVIKNK